MTIAICDDEKAARSYIRGLIEKRCADAKIIEFSSGAELLTYVNADKGQVDILFLDISFESELDGIETAKLLRQKQSDESAMAALPVLIFVTAFAHRMPEAFPVHAFQFLVKPIDPAAFDAVFEQAVKEYYALDELRRSREQKLLIRSNGSTVGVALQDIYYIESDGRKSVVVQRDRRSAYYKKTEELAQELGDGFYRVHRSFLVNMAHVRSYTRTQIVLDNGEAIPMSKYQYAGFVQAYISFVSEGGV